MNKRIIIAIIIIAVIFIGTYFLFGLNKQPASLMTSQQVNEVEGKNITIESNATQIGGNYEVIYTNSGYSPSELKIKIGDIVTFKNQSFFVMWTASGMHPSHMLYSGTSLQEHCPDITNTSFDECQGAQPGESWSFTFEKRGTWPYHNHVKASDFGKIVVE